MIRLRPLKVIARVLWSSQWGERLICHRFSTPDTYQLCVDNTNTDSCPLSRRNDNGLIQLSNLPRDILTYWPMQLLALVDMLYVYAFNLRYGCAHVYLYLTGITNWRYATSSYSTPNSSLSQQLLLHSVLLLLRYVHCYYCDPQTEHVTEKVWMIA